VGAPSPGDFFGCRGVTGKWGPCDSTTQVDIVYWPRGPYRVDLFVDKQRIATDSFSMLGKDDLDGEMWARMSDESAPTRYITSLKGRVKPASGAAKGAPGRRARRLDRHSLSR
jgi:hypothetical protein